MVVAAMKKERSYIDNVHKWGSIWSITALLVLFSVPLVFSLYYDAFPNGTALKSAALKVIPIYWGSAVVEVFTYTPLMGAGATYLSFVTGNITNLKMPCALNALDRTGYRGASEEGEVISTIAVAGSAITTTVVIAIGVLVFGPAILRLTSPGSVMAPAFIYVLPALFGALGASYFSKYWKISILPIVLGSVVYIFIPTLSVGTMIFVTIIISVFFAYIMYKLKIIK